jgi:DNA repair protein SbcC/Rad50
VADQRAVHELLATELGPRRFEAWLLEEALASLVAGASDRLEQLSSGRYAMAIDDKKQFEVIDHANADERRLARTLSGGETFLASLALALALAERVTELAGSGRASLDAIFLDEGFGTLDPDTLDVVASAIEELGASGRMVGVVSHVRELADRVPVRFEVRRGIDSSTVERVDL